MTRLSGLALLSLLLLQYATSEELLERQERGAKRRQKVLKPVPGCEWKLDECNPKKGRCGKGLQTATLNGAGCPSKTKRVRCKIPCREEVRGPITGLSPSEAGLKGEAVSSRVSSISKNRKKKDRKCRYTKGDWSPCDETTQQIKRTLALKRGDSSVCPPTKEIVKKCKKACKYEKGGWSECNPITNTRTRTSKLKKGDPATCQPTKSVTRRCKNGKRGKKKKRKKKKNKVGKAKGCKYTRADWSECNIASNSRTRVLTLRKGDPNRCQPTITIKRKCKKPCKYTRGEWSPCNPTTNLRSRTLTLRKGDSETCQVTKIVTRKCKKPCRYSRGQWSECDSTTLMKTRTDQLKAGNSESVCDTTRTVTKPCKVKDKSKCKYDIKPWSDCDPKTRERTREKLLLEGGPSCQATKTIRRSCQKNNGEERCFFGPWGEFNECRNGVRTKIRKVISGPDACQRKAVKMKSCKSRKAN